MRFSGTNEARTVKQSERYYILRPETVESYFLMWRPQVPRLGLGGGPGPGQTL